LASWRCFLPENVSLNSVAAKTSRHITTSCDEGRWPQEHW
jgi:hypothetical protein